MPSLANARRHFCPCDADLSDGASWIKHVTPPTNKDLLKPYDNKMMLDTLAKGGKRQPGPDGIRGEVWRRLRQVCCGAFSDAALCLLAGGRAPENLNEANAAHLPKVVCPWARRRHQGLRDEALDVEESLR